MQPQNQTVPRHCLAYNQPFDMVVTLTHVNHVCLPDSIFAKTIVVDHGPGESTSKEDESSDFSPQIHFVNIPGKNLSLCHLL